MCLAAGWCVLEGTESFSGDELVRWKLEAPGLATLEYEMELVDSRSQLLKALAMPAKSPGGGRAQIGLDAGGHGQSRIAQAHASACDDTTQLETKLVVVYHAAAAA